MVYRRVPGKSVAVQVNGGAVYVAVVRETDALDEVFRLAGPVWHSVVRLHPSWARKLAISLLQAADEADVQEYLIHQAIDQQIGKTYT